MNIYCIFQVGYLATMKHAVSVLGVDPLDQVISRNLISTLFALVVALGSSQSFAVAKGMRLTLFFRSCAGVAGNTAMTFGIALVPLVFQQTISATAPFWAALCGFCIIGETISCVTSVAMVVSFLGVATVACSPYILGESTEDSEDIAS